MSLVYTSGPYRNDLYVVGGSRQTFLNSINTSLVASAWTSANLYAFSEISWTGQPAAATTCTINGQVYTWRAAIGAPANEVLIGVDASTSYTNLYNAINLGPGVTTTYSTATTLNGTTTAADYRATATTTGKFRVQSKINTTPFGQQDVLSFSTTSANVGFTWATNKNAGYKWTSPKTSLGNQQMVIYGIDALETARVRLMAMDENELYRSNQLFPYNSGSSDNTAGFIHRVDAYANWRVICSPSHLLVFADSAGAPTGTNSASYFSIPYITPYQVPVVITGATNATPIVVTTATAHGRTTGDSVFVRGVLGNTSVNGISVCTVITATTFSVPQAGNGAYTSGGVMCKSTNDKVGMSIVATNDAAGAIMFPMSRLSMNGNYCWQTLNGLSFNTTGVNAIGMCGVIIAAPAAMQDAATSMQFMDGTFVLTEPHFASSGATAAKALWVGQLYDTFISLTPNIIGTTANVDGRNWYCVGSYAGTTSSACGSVWIVVP